jgi:LDH2 family malate/lactate/ureidoglycolate dehydrogenase
MTVYRMRTDSLFYKAPHQFTVRALYAVAAACAAAVTSADWQVTTNVWALCTRGTSLPAGCLRRIKRGARGPYAVPRVVGEGSAWATVDGRAAHDRVASDFAGRAVVANGVAARRRVCKCPDFSPLLHRRLPRMARGADANRGDTRNLTDRAGRQAKHRTLMLSGRVFAWTVCNLLWDGGAQPTCEGAESLTIGANAILPAQDFAGRMESLADESGTALLAEGVAPSSEVNEKRRAVAAHTGLPFPDCEA